MISDVRCRAERRRAGPTAPGRHPAARCCSSAASSPSCRARRASRRFALLSKPFDQGRASGGGRTGAAARVTKQPDQENANTKPKGLPMTFVSQGEEPRRPRATRPNRPRRKAAYSAGDIRLLVLDDDPAIGRLIQAALAPARLPHRRGLRPDPDRVGPARPDLSPDHPRLRDPRAGVGAGLRLGPRAPAGREHHRRDRLSRRSTAP